MNIEELQPSVRLYNCLKRANINTVEELCNLDDDDFVRYGIGQKYIDEIHELLKDEICTKSPSVSQFRRMAIQMDYVQVIRCKDCKHWNDGHGIGWCELNSKILPSGDWTMWDENDFCSCGERESE